ncbi:MAG: hypothetical protein WBG81_06505 [Rhodanobacter sp.]|jgi:hypothetical protein|uniref:hypothetical protein n=1 Tax=Rhodanobacter sp. KK11 TaxID=3083255 RepID=UPI0029674B02|nr:hypothetical protein [Rhodanobacter sp. KK11]MDW2979980.1 hypothetical protein [Rhodanobacter sp. KK11]
MKHLTIATAIAFGLSCIVGVGAAQDTSQTANLQRVTVTAVPGQYETYTVDLDAGYGLQALVGHTHRQYLQARREAERSEALRKQGMAAAPFVTVALDDSSGPGMATRILLFDASDATVAITDVHCKRVAPAGGQRCQLFSRGARGQGLASMGTGSLRVAELSRP